MIEKTTIKMKKGIKPNKPILIVGLPGIGNVGKLVVEHLRREFEAKKFATMYSPHFPHQVVMLKNGGIRLVNNRFYIIKAKERRSDIILLTGDVQAVTTEGQYEVNAKIIKFFKEELGGGYIYTIGGYNINEGAVQNPRVFGNVTDKKLIVQFKGTEVLFGKSRGTIFGSAGMIIAFAKMERLDGVCLMGETSFLSTDASAAKAVIIQLSKKLNLDINTGNLDKIIERTAKAITELEKQVGGLNIGQPQGYPAVGGKDNDDDNRRPSYIR